MSTASNVRNAALIIAFLSFLVPASFGLSWSITAIINLAERNRVSPLIICVAICLIALAVALIAHLIASHQGADQ